jgi:galactose mutarotase-like enzyme
MQGIEVAKKENVVMQAGDCSVTILPHLGGKIASIRIGDQELLQEPLAAYAPRTRTMSFDEGDASGWDECLPSVAACSVETEAGTASVPDHGDLWRVEWKSKEKGIGNREQNGRSAQQTSTTLYGECFSLPLTLRRKTILKPGSKGGWALRLNYELVNTGIESVPWSWAAHPLFIAEEGDRIVLPDSIRELRLEGSGGGRLGNSGDQVSWPVAALARGGRTDLSVVQGPTSGIGDKLFAGPLGAEENWCALERDRAGARIALRLDTKATPYLGLWICYGGWPDRPGAKQMCVAMEPATAPVDSLAQTGSWSRKLEPGATFSWSMEIQILGRREAKAHARS